jgi:nitrite reductase/ring-hydroxylating ferredoxin subunit
VTETDQNRHFVGRKDELIHLGRKIVNVGKHEVGVFYVDGEFYAWLNYCPHFAAPVCRGEICGTRLPSHVYEYKFGLEGQILRCPWHGWEFDLKTGQHLADEKTKLKGVPLEIENGNVYIIFKARA